MKSTLKIVTAVLLMASSAAFAAGQAPAPAPAPAAAATPAATAAAPMTDLAAHKKQIRADKKVALAACKALKGAEKTTCKKDAKAHEMTAMADLKAKK